MKTYTTYEVAIILRDLMFPKNGRPFFTLNKYDQRRYIRGAVKVLEYLESESRMV